MVEKINKKQILLLSLPNIIVSFLLLGVMYTFHLTYLGFVILIMSISLLKYLYNVYKDVSVFSSWLIIKELFISYIFVSCVWFLGRLLGGYGFFGLFLIVVILSGFMIWNKREFVMKGIREVETQMFSKPLDKKNWRSEKK